MDTFKIIGALPMSERIAVLKKEMLDESRYATIEQARIITKSYRQTEGQPRCIQRAKALKAALEEMTIRIEPHERIVGNRTPGVCPGANASGGGAVALVFVRHFADGGQRLLVFSRADGSVFVPVFHLQPRAGYDAGGRAGDHRMSVAEVQSAGISAQFQQRKE